MGNEKLNIDDDDHTTSKINIPDIGDLLNDINKVSGRWVICSCGDPDCHWQPAEFVSE